MRAYYGAQGRDVFEYLPLTYHVKSLADPSWAEFNQRCASFGEKAVWIVKPGENSNRGRGISVHHDLGSIRALVESEAGVRGRTFIIQKYI